MRRGLSCGPLLLVLVVGVDLPGARAADEAALLQAHQGQEGQDRDASAFGPLASPADIEAAIQALTDPTDYERVNAIFSDLVRLEDPAQQERLHLLLDARLQALMSSPEEITVEEHAPPEADLAQRIESLRLGPQATAEDLLARDQLVAQLAGIRDPIMRHELLARLEQRERQAEEMTERP